MTMYPFPSASYSASDSTGGARGLGNSVRPVSPPGTRFPDAVSRPGSKRRRGHRLPFGSALVSVLPRVDRAVRTVPPAVCSIHKYSSMVRAAQASPEQPDSQKYCGPGPGLETLFCESWLAGISLPASVCAGCVYTAPACQLAPPRATRSAPMARALRARRLQRA